MRLVGFTGSAEGISHRQRLVLVETLVSLRTTHDDWFLFGLCTGADEEVAKLAEVIGYQLEGFPGREVGQPYRSLMRVDREHRVPGGNTPELTRNRTIVRSCEVLLAAPHGYKELRRSGTWATIREARKVHRERIIVWRDGTKTTEFAGNIVPYPGPNPPALGLSGVS